MTRQELTDADLIRSLASTTCLACGGKKKRGHTFCFADYRRLPGNMRSDLYRRVGYGYGEAVLLALEEFEVDEPHLPPERE